MPRIAVPITPITRAGVAPPAETNGDPVNNHSVPNDGRTVLLVRNANATSTVRTLTIRLPGAVDGQGITPRTYPIAAGASRYIGPFSPTEYGALMQVDVDNAELKLTALRI
ncbi:hypothetical protein CSH63_17930 [Micromonospora tulbaghiae]|uniref:Uncharacterized protein n=1 Tax=Micromonospora tulbaghiae TaxID=479978 RepID=A0A386WPJ0_9ACTN|nr:hypothetical protein [Micromonospora tulbaghiae]AYF29310.1 hypothetical protein CSH63_17930 [Micromonospora tulbaghiae]